jgi:shikimate kinase
VFVVPPPPPAPPPPAPPAPPRQRPLLAAPNRRERLLELAAQRDPLYREVADLIVPAAGVRNVAALASRLAAQLRADWRRGAPGQAA